MTAKQREFIAACKAVEAGVVAKPTCVLKKWVGRDGGERLYLNSSEIEFGVKLWLDCRGMIEGHWQVCCQVGWLSDKSRYIDLAYELLRNTYGREFVTTATWQQMLEKAV